MQTDVCVQTCLTGWKNTTNVVFPSKKTQQIVNQTKAMPASHITYNLPKVGKNTGFGRMAVEERWRKDY